MHKHTHERVPHSLEAVCTVKQHLNLLLTTREGDIQLFRFNITQLLALAN